MSETTKIQWTDATWNIARGCTKVDEDCKFCYMYRDSMDSTRYNPLQVVRTKTVFNMPLKLKEPSKIFTSSLTDVFHEDIDGYRNEMWDIIRRCPQHTFQILTKRPERIKGHLPEDWGEGWKNVWLGTSCGSQSSEKRMKDLIKVPAKVRFLSLEPLHGPIELWNMEEGVLRGPAVIESGGMTIGTSDFPAEGYDDSYPGIDWVIVGGESGNEKGKYRYRPCELDWIERIVNDCQKANVSLFVKQMGTHLAKRLKMTDRHGGNIDEFPEHLRIREFPTPNN